MLGKVRLVAFLRRAVRVVRVVELRIGRIEVDVAQHRH